MLPSWTPKDLDDCLAELEQNGAIVDLKTARAVFIPWFLSFNACPESPNVVKAWRKRWIELPESHLKSEVDSSVAAFLAEFRPAKADSGTDESAWVEAWHGSNTKRSRNPAPNLQPTFREGSRQPSSDRASTLPRTYPEPGIRTQGSGSRDQRTGIGEQNPGNGVRKGEQEAGIRGETTGGNLDNEPFDPPDAAGSDTGRRSGGPHLAGLIRQTRKQRTLGSEATGQMIRRVTEGGQ
jgi:hypothetical protein